MQLKASENAPPAVPEFKGQDLQTQALREKGLLFCIGIAMPALILILWEVTTRQGWIDELFLPSISGIVRVLCDRAKGLCGHSADLPYLGKPAPSIYGL